MTTIVTSYFQLNQSKASHLQYVEWMKNMLMIDNPMVIFCDEKSEETIYMLRSGKHDKTRIIVTNFKEFYSYVYAITKCLMYLNAIKRIKQTFSIFHIIQIN